METTGAYLQRKGSEIRLIAGWLAAPRALRPPRSVAEVVEQKFRLAAALKAERALAGWSSTETRWGDAGRTRIGPYEIRYGYQRADLAIDGPSPYGFAPEGDVAAIYTSSGMGAISAVLAALGRIAGGVDMWVPPGCYRETLEAIELCGRELRVLRRDARRAPGDRNAALMVDSYVEGELFRPDLATRRPDLVVFDTTCLAASSGRIRRVLASAARAGLPCMLVRSHTKLDSLGIEYGRLGSAVLVVPRHVAPAGRALAEGLAQGVQDAVRLFGSAAIPAHLPPFAGTTAYRSLSALRVAAIMRNTRRLARGLARALPADLQVKSFRHGLYLTLGPSIPWAPEEAQAAARSLTDRLRARALPVRHAGSFGFDFVAAEEFVDARTERNVVRLSPADVPGALIDEIADEIVAWRRARVRRPQHPPGLAAHGASRPFGSAGLAEAARPEA